MLLPRLLVEVQALGIVDNLVMHVYVMLMILLAAVAEQVPSPASHMSCVQLR